MKISNYFLGNLDGMTDQRLLELYRTSNDAKYMAVLYARYLDMIYGLCLRYTPNAMEAEDYCQNIYIKLLDKMQKMQPDNFRAFLYTLVRNYCIDQTRKVIGKNVEIFPDRDMHLSVDPRQEGEDLNEKERVEAILTICLGELRDEQRACIKQFYFENRTYVNIAKQLNLQVSQVRSYLQNGRRNLKKCMDAK